MTTPVFSVVIPLYNKEKYIGKTLESVLLQDFTDFEVVLVDDGSTDNGSDIAKGFDDPRIRILRQENLGVSSARNRGIREAKGDFIAFLDADDEWMENKLQTHLTCFKENPECHWTVSAFIHRSGDRETVIGGGKSDVIQDALQALANNALEIWTGSVVARTSCFGTKCLFSTGVSTSEDREVWLKLACQYPLVGYLGQPLSIYNAGLPGALTSIAIRSGTYPFLNLESRIALFSEALEVNRKKCLQQYLRRFNRNACLLFWVSNQAFLATAGDSCLAKYFSRKELLLMRTLNDMPSLFKKIARKVIWPAQLEVSRNCRNHPEEQ